MRRFCSWDLEISSKRDIDMRVEMGSGSFTFSGPFTGKFFLKMKRGTIRYHGGDFPAHDFEARVAFGSIESEVEGIIPRPFFPFGRRVMILNPMGRGDIILKIRSGSIRIMK